MKKAFLFMFLLVSLFFFSFQVDAKCQYECNEEYFDHEIVLTYEGTDKIEGKELNFSDFRSGEHPSFIVYNPNYFQVTAVLNFTVDGLIKYERSHGQKIDPYSNVQVRDHCCNKEKCWNCTINQDTLGYYISKPKRLFPTLQKVTKNRTLCDQPCSNDSVCGLGVCNIAGYCGTKKVVPCQSGTDNCQNLSCLAPATKEFNEQYSCEWECKSGGGKNGICRLNDGESCSKASDCISNECNFDSYCGSFIDCQINGTKNCKNQSCLQPSIKKKGVSFLCEWECKCGVGKDNLCKGWEGWRFIRISGEIIFGVFLIIIIWRFIIKMEGEERDRAEKRKRETMILKHKAKMKEIQKNIEADEKKSREVLKRSKEVLLQISNKNKVLEKRKKELRRLEDIKNKTKEIKKKIKEEGLEIKNVLHNKVQNIEKLQIITNQEVATIENLRKTREDRDKEIEKEIEARKKPRTINKHISGKYYLDNEGYPCFYNTYKKDPYSKTRIHNKIYEKETGEKINSSKENIHHIDSDPENYSVNNLIKLNIGVHKNLQHNKIKRGDYKSGIKVLKEAKIEIPKRIQDYLEQKKLLQ